MLSQSTGANLPFTKINNFMPVPLAELSKARAVFGRSNTGIVGSNPPRGMDVCPLFSEFMLSCV
jgi:hypothetical protein